MKIFIYFGWNRGGNSIENLRSSGLCNFLVYYSFIKIVVIVDDYWELRVSLTWVNLGNDNWFINDEYYLN